jgi:hypothetical protein
MAEQKQEQKQEQAAKDSVKRNNDGFVPGQRLSPKELSEFKLKQRQKAKK